MLRRARLCFVLALVAAAIVMLAELPVGQLMQARGSVAKTSSELATLERENRTLSGQVKQLKQGSLIGQIAHEEYGLVAPGERAFVIMPGSGATVRSGSSPQPSAGESAPLGSTTIPRSDIVPSDAELSSPPGAVSSGSSRSFWSRLLNRFEFWKASI